MEENLKELSDEALMNRYQLGDYSAFETLYLRHSGRILGFLKKKVAASVAEELTQEVFRKLHESRSKYNSQYPFLPWVFTITRNSLYDFFKLSETKVYNESSSSDILLGQLLADTVATDKFDLNLGEILKHLPTAQKRAIELRYLDEWSFEKIAFEMKTSQENVRQLVSRGIKSVRAKIQKGGPSGR